MAGLDPKKVQLHTTFLGGGFGRRAEFDFIADAVELSKATHVPVKVVYSREDDMQHDMYRPASYNVLAAGLGADGNPVAWTHRAVSDGPLMRFFPSMVPAGQPDPSGLEGAANIPYTIPNTVITNTATYTDPAGAGTQATVLSNTTTHPVTAPADLVITKYASVSAGSSVLAGGTSSADLSDYTGTGDITYTITIRNDGPNTATNVMVRDVVPANTNGIGTIYAPQMTCHGDEVITGREFVCKPNTPGNSLAPGQTKQIQYRINVPPRAP